MYYKEIIKELNKNLQKHNFKLINCCLNCANCFNIGVDEDVYECQNEEMKLCVDNRTFYPSVLNGICNLYKEEE